MKYVPKYLLKQVITFYFIIFLFYGTTYVTVFKGPKRRFLCSRYEKIFNNGISKIFGKEPFKQNISFQTFIFYRDFLQELLLGPFLNTLSQMISYGDQIWWFIFEICNMLIRNTGDNNIRKFHIYTCFTKLGAINNSLIPKDKLRFTSIT